MNETVFLATGGTGGHVFPARALADELKARGLRVVVVTDQRGQNYETIFEGAEISRIDAASPSRARALAKVSVAVTVAKGVSQARRLIAEARPAVVVGFGGYASLPTMLAAAFRRVPTVIHEQNAVFGRVNKLLAPWVRSIALSFPGTRGIELGQSGKIVVTGNPVHREIARIGEAAYEIPRARGGRSLLVFGGSQGAHILSKTVPEAVSLLDAEMRAELHVVQQCRPEDLEVVAEFYRQKEISAELGEFFDDMPARLAAADLIIARAGASTVYEIATARRASILVPFAAAADGHQALNAAALADCGAAKVIGEADLNARQLSICLASLLADPAALAKMADQARAFARVDAAARLADLVVALIEQNGQGGRLAA